MTTRVHQIKGKYDGVKTGQGRSEAEKRKHTEELGAFEKMSVSYSDQELINCSSTKEVKFENKVHASYLTKTLTIVAKN